MSQHSFAYCKLQYCATYNIVNCIVNCNIVQFTYYCKFIVLYYKFIKFIILYYCKLQYCEIYSKKKQQNMQC